MLAALLATFIIPAGYHDSPVFMFRDLKLLDDLGLHTPGDLHAGIRSAIFVLIFYQFFQHAPALA